MEQKNETAKKENNDLKNKLKNMESKHKDDIAKVQGERDELIKSLTKVEHKET